MTKKLYVGGFGNGASDEFINILKGEVKDYGKTISTLILPNGYLINKAREELFSASDLALNHRIYTFDDIVESFSYSTPQKMITKSVQLYLVRKIILELEKENKLKAFNNIKKYPGITNNVLAAINELKRSLITPEALLEIRNEDSFIYDLSNIYEKYERELNILNVTDREGRYLNFIQNKDPKDLKIFEGRNIFIDQFYDFRPIELELIRILSKHAKEIYVNADFGQAKQNNIYKSFVSQLKEMGFELVIKNGSIDFFKALATELIESNTHEKIDPLGRITLLKAQYKKLEIKYSLNMIKKLVLEDCDMSEILVVLADESYYQDLINEASLVGIPLNCNKEVALINGKLVHDILAELKTVLQNGNKKHLILKLKSRFTKKRILGSEIEKKILPININNANEILQILKVDNLGLEEYFLLNISEVINDIETQDLKLNKSARFEEHINSTIQYIKNLQIPKLLLEELRATDNMEQYQIDLKFYTQFLHILENVYHSKVITESITFEEFIKILETILEEETINMLESATNGIRVVDIGIARGQASDHTFILGLSSNNYPKIVENNFILNKERTNRLKAIGFKNRESRDDLDNEEIKFSSAISTPKKTLTLSYSEINEDVEDKPSWFLENLINKLIFEKEIKNSFNRVVNTIDYLLMPLSEHANKLDLLDSAIFKIRDNQLDYEEASFIYNEFEEFMNNIQALYNVYELRLTKGSKYNGYLKDSVIISRLKDELDKRIWSASELEAYSNCPFTFLLQKLFNISEIDIYDQERDNTAFGNLAHKALYMYYQIYHDSITELDNKALDISFLELKKLLYKEANELKYNIEDPIDRLELEYAFYSLKEYVNMDIERLKSNDLKPYAFEYKFGWDYSFFIENNNRKIFLRGIIDRIDESINHKYSITDYKSSNFGTKSLKSIKEGGSFQLLLYMMAIRNSFESNYAILKKPQIKRILRIIDDKEKSKANEMKIEEYEALITLTKERINGIIESIKAGNFGIEPLQCSPYCTYKDICFYDRRKS